MTLLFTLPILVFAFFMALSIIKGIIKHWRGVLSCIIFFLSCLTENWEIMQWTLFLIMAFFIGKFVYKKTKRMLRNTKQFLGN